MGTRLATRKRTVALGAFVLAVLAFPVLVPGSYPLGVGIIAGAMAAGTVGFVLLIGYAQQLALGQAGFCMIGGYASAILCVRYGWDPLVALVTGAVLSMAIAHLLAVPVLKLRGFVLAMASLALHLILIVVALEAPFTGGALGTYGVPKFAVLGLPLHSDLAFYFLVWLAVLGALAIGLNIDRSRIGRALKAIAVSEMAAGAVGIDITRYKAHMFVISAAMASVSGSLAVHFLRAMDPNVFGFAYSLNLITAVIIGGLTSIWGGALGAAAVTGLRELLRGVSLPLWESVIMGALTVVVLIAFPRGLAGALAALFERAAGHKADARAAGGALDPAALAPIRDAPAPGAPLLEIAGACRAFGSLLAVNEVSFAIPAGSISALIGPNGAGKTTMFNLICGYQPFDRGSATFGGERIDRLLPNEVAQRGIGRTFQNLQLFDNLTVLENVMCGRHRLMSAGLLDVCARLPKVGREEAAAERVALDCLRFVGLQGAEMLNPSALAFGHQRLVEIARALAAEPRLLLMDEPASGLNDSETEHLAELILRISALGITVLLVEHDMRLVMGLADHIVVMHHGEKIADGPVDQVRADPQVVAAYLGAAA